MMNRIGLSIVVMVVFALVSCRTIENMAMGSVANMLSGSDAAGTFTSDNDPQLIADALPLTLKLYEMMFEKFPENDDLAVATGKIFVMYSAAFVQIPMERLEEEEWREEEKMRLRAKKLFRRGRRYLFDALALRHENFFSQLQEGDYEDVLDMLEEEDVEAIYWLSLAWLGMASTDPFDMALLTTLDQVAVLLYWILEQDETRVDIHDLMIRLQLSLPASVLVNARTQSSSTQTFMDKYYQESGVDADPFARAFYHYNRALELSEGKAISPHITMATTMAVRNQDVEAFRDYLDKALTVDPEENPDERLMAIIYKERAAWLLDNIEKYFLIG